MITVGLAILLVTIGATLGAGTVALCVAARRGDDDADVAQFLSSIEFSQFNQGRDVLVNRQDFNRMARLAARNAPLPAGSGAATSRLARTGGINGSRFSEDMGPNPEAVPSRVDLETSVR